MSFTDVDTKYNKKSFKVLDVLAEIQKNKFSTVRIAKIEYGGAEFIQLQVWKEKDGVKFAAKGQNIIIQLEVAHALGEALIKL